ncbi:sulfite exporter TauE/SafE family protein [Faecalibacter sp. LW9]|uniref:sulfite exporter TauE/SafE family protein n=1 Tax=Faecalibacter sp. LW9 TaxID=3103144 RepID=UPI002AFEA1B7|nr:sulfite exporter TauE/SafE family protein [Faecalibacter sp. LW9]
MNDYNLNDIPKETKSVIIDEYLKRKKANPTHQYKRFATWTSTIFLSFFFDYALATYYSYDELSLFVSQIPNEFYIMLAVGIFAQLVDGALGLSYGIMCASAMMSFGVKLPAISGSIYTAEMFSSSVSGFSHYKFGNVNKKMLIWLAIPGVVGSILGSLFVIYIG